MESSLTPATTIFGISSEDVMRVIRDGNSRYQVFVGDKHAYDHIAEEVVWVSRGYIAKLIKDGDVKKAPVGYQLEHVFEIQYFAIAFILAVRCYRDSIREPRWFPASNDIRWAAILINNMAANVRPLSKDDHLKKSAYFRMGSENPVLAANDPIIAYLVDAATNTNTGFAALVDFNYKTLYEKSIGDVTIPLNVLFQVGFLEILRATPWYNGKWPDIFCTGSTPITFATNIKNSDKLAYYETIAQNFDQDVFAPNAQ